MSITEFKTKSDKIITVVTATSPDENLSNNDKEMDFRAKKAVEAAIEKARICKKPIAKYDAKNKRAYIEYPNGEIKYVSE